MSSEAIDQSDEAIDRHTPRTGSTTFITTSGGLLTEQLVSKLRQRQCEESAVRPETFTLPDQEPAGEAELEAEIADAWDTLRERWDEVTMTNELFGMDVSDARNKWILRLFRELGFDPIYQRENLEAGGIEAHLSHKGWPDEGISNYGEMEGRRAPILHTVEPEQTLDEKPEDAPRGAKSPHDTLQKFLNASDNQDWAVVTNGLTLRVLRDYYHTYTRGYVEIDLENMFTNRNYGDFRALYRLCHASRFIEPVVADEEEEDVETPLEQLYQVALSTGVKVGQDLQENVVSALETLGNGFLNSKIEEELQEGGQEAAEDYYQDLLYVVYRLLFLMFAEQRGIMSQRDSLYTEEYSITKLRERAEQREEGDRNKDLWEGLKATFRLVGEGDESLGVPAYNGGLFDDDNLEFILDVECLNEKLLSAVHDLTHIEQGGYQQRISYADLGVEEIGAVYESLLEFTPQLAETVIEFEDRTITSGSFYLDDRGMDRKETGSYYTDPGLIQHLIQSALKPTVDDRLNEAGKNPDAQEEALLDISVCDPACGSGAFLIAANNYLGQRLAQVRTDSLYPGEQTIRHARRAVVQHCIYGVDKNPMAVELAKVSLWINSAVEDKPLSFLDHRIRQGNSLIGTTPELISEGLPDEAYETSQGREYHIGTDIRRLVRNQSKKVQSELSWYEEEKSEYVSLAEKLEEVEEEDIDDIHRKEEIYTQIRESESFQREKAAHDAWTAAYFWPLEKYESRAKEYESEVGEDEKARKIYLQENEDEFPTPKTIEKLRRNLPELVDGDLEDLKGLTQLRARSEKLAQEESFFHWPLEFPGVYAEDGGFDCILGNPPWDKLALEEKEFFAVSAPHIADSSLTQSERDDLIQELEENNPKLYREHEAAERQIQNQKDFIKHSGRFPLTSHGIINLYAPFAGLALREINEHGASGIIVPTGIATDSNTQEYFQELVENKRLASLFDFQNRKGIFPDVHKSYKFSLMTIFGDGLPQNQFDLAFYLREIEHLQDESRQYSLTPHDIKTVNPNTRNCPTFRTKDDAETTLRIYKGETILRHEDDEEEDWGVSFSRMFNAGDDSNLFERKDTLERQGLELEGNLFKLNAEVNYVPVYESKMVNQYDHRFATYRDVSKSKVKDKKPREMTADEKDAGERALPPYWIDIDQYNDKWNNDEWHIAIRNVTNATNRRTVISTILPAVASEHSINHMLRCDVEQALVLVSCLNSYVLDYVARQKIGGENLSHYILKQLPAPTPKRLNNLHYDGKSIRTQIRELATKLIYTNGELDYFADKTDCVGGPYQFTEPEGRKREDVRYDLEAVMCHAYGIRSDDFRQVFDSFEQIKNEDLNKYGYYRTRDEIKKRFNEQAPKIIDTTGESR